MQIIRNKKNSKKIILVSLSVLILLALISFFYFYIVKGSILGWSPIPKQEVTDGTNYNKPTDDQLKNGQDIKKQSVDNTKGSSGSDQPASPTPQSDDKSTVGVEITHTGQTASSLQIRSLISAIGTGGKCTLTLQKAGHSSITKTSDVQNLSDTSTCQGFDIPLAELETGNWQVSITYENATLTGSASTSVVIN